MSTYIQVWNFKLVKPAKSNLFVVITYNKKFVNECENDLIFFVAPQ